MQTIHSIPPGAALARSKAAGWTQHVGIYVGNGIVFHNTPTNGEHLATVDTFATSQPLHVFISDAARRQRALIGVRSALKAPRPYSLLSNNCEHTLTRAFGLRPNSPQLGQWALIFAIGLLAVSANRSSPRRRSRG